MKIKCSGAIYMQTNNYTESENNNRFETYVYTCESHWTYQKLINMSRYLPYWILKTTVFYAQTRICKVILENHQCSQPKIHGARTRQPPHNIEYTGLNDGTLQPNQPCGIFI